MGTFFEQLYIFPIERENGLRTEEKRERQVSQYHTASEARIEQQQSSSTFLLPLATVAFPLKKTSIGKQEGINSRKRLRGGRNLNIFN